MTPEQLPNITEALFAIARALDRIADALEVENMIAAHAASASADQHKSTA